ncbi:CDP-alcohol phosphatidyltransferase family protein, partial [Streptomyces sp. JJ36]|nr:CDP-alcohol phosphatidyltransferase family protein [Streptomyces sp. JJ36]
MSPLPTAILTGPPAAGSSLEDDLGALGFAVRAAEGPAEAAAELAGLPAGERVALVDRRFVGHRHSLRLALTDPRFPCAAVPGALVAGPAARAALVRALRGRAEHAAEAGGAEQADTSRAADAPPAATAASGTSGQGEGAARPASGTAAPPR